MDSLLHIETKKQKLRQTCCCKFTEVSSNCKARQIPPHLVTSAFMLLETNYSYFIVTFAKINHYLQNPSSGRKNMMWIVDHEIILVTCNEWLYHEIFLWLPCVSCPCEIVSLFLLGPPLQIVFSTPFFLFILSLLPFSIFSLLPFLISPSLSTIPSFSSDQFSVLLRQRLQTFIQLVYLTKCH